MCSAIYDSKSIQEGPKIVEKERMQLNPSIKNKKKSHDYSAAISHKYSSVFEVDLSQSRVAWSLALFLHTLVAITLHFQVALAACRTDSALTDRLADIVTWWLAALELVGNGRRQLVGELFGGEVHGVHWHVEQKHAGELVFHWREEGWMIVKHSRKNSVCCI